MKRALFSLSNLTGAADFALALTDIGYEIVATGGTARALTAAGISVTSAESLTGFADLLDGRVKTLHPAIHGGLLARRTEADLSQLRTLGISPFDLLICNLYPFEEKADGGADFDELIENIDIGGVALLRAAAKNHACCPPICDPADYPAVLAKLTEGGLSAQYRRQLAIKAFAHTACYDSLIWGTLAQKTGQWPGEPLRYGENPWQTAALVKPAAGWKVHGGKTLSYNNLLDLDAALTALQLLGTDEPAAALIKHTVPCGIGRGATLAEAFRKAFACDPRSPYGGVALFNRAPTEETLDALKGLFLELLVVPSIAREEAERLAQTRKNLRLITCPGPFSPRIALKSTRAGLLAQTDGIPPLPHPDEVQWIGTPRPDLWSDLMLAWAGAALAKSNAIALAKNGGTLAIAGGCTGRVQAVEICLARAGNKAQDAVLASDAFFPFADSIRAAVQAGVKCFIQPGGSMRDEEVFDAVLKAGGSMALTGQRTFKH